MMASICLFVLSALYVIATANVLGDATPFNFVETSRTISTDFGPPDPHSHDSASTGRDPRGKIHLVRGLVQRVRQASVTVAGEVVGAIGQGLVVLVGVTHHDTAATAKKLADKLWNLRVMDDDEGVMNRSVADTTKQVLIVSQFTLYADTSGGRRPSYIEAARPEHAEPMVDAVVGELRRLGAAVATGRFRTEMQVALVNDGPVTVMVEV